MGVALFHVIAYEPLWGEFACCLGSSVQYQQQFRGGSSPESNGLDVVL